MREVNINGWNDYRENLRVARWERGNRVFLRVLYLGIGVRLVFEGIGEL